MLYLLIIAIGVGKGVAGDLHPPQLGRSEFKVPTELKLKFQSQFQKK